jgi:hypothetical protein
LPLPRRPSRFRRLRRRGAFWLAIGAAGAFAAGASAQTGTAPKTGAPATRGPAPAGPAAPPENPAGGPAEVGRPSATGRVPAPLPEDRFDPSERVPAGSSVSFPVDI